MGTRGRWGERLGWDVSVYDIELWDEIQNVNVQPFPGAPFTIPRFQNIDRSRHTGVEVGGDLLLVKDLAPRIGLGSTGDALRARVAYTWSHFVFVDDPTFGNNDLPGAPAHFITAELRYDHASGFWIAPGVEIVPQGYFVNSANTVRTPAYTLVNVKVGFDYKPWNLGVFFEGRNLTDKSFVSAVNVDDATATTSSRATAGRSTARSRGGGNERTAIDARPRGRRLSSWPRRPPRAPRRTASRSVPGSS